MSKNTALTLLLAAAYLIGCFTLGLIVGRPGFPPAAAQEPPGQADGEVMVRLGQPTVKVELLVSDSDGDVDLEAWRAIGHAFREGWEDGYQKKHAERQIHYLSMALLKDGESGWLELLSTRVARAIEEARDR